MELREDLPDPGIEEIASILAAGYLRLCMRRRHRESAPLAPATSEPVDDTPSETRQ